VVCDQSRTSGAHLGRTVFCAARWGACEFDRVHAFRDTREMQREIADHRFPAHIRSGGLVYHWHRCQLRVCLAQPYDCAGVSANN
jgi:hypothetical protein